MRIIYLDESVNEADAISRSLGSNDIEIIENADREIGDHGFRASLEQRRKVLCLANIHPH